MTMLFFHGAPLTYLTIPNLSVCPLIQGKIIS
jgi:hypothetical protein